MSDRANNTPILTNIYQRQLYYKLITVQREVTNSQGFIYMGLYPFGCE